MGVFKKEKKRVDPVQAIAHFTQRGVHVFDRVIDIPPGGKFLVRFAQDPKLVDADGNTLRVYNWEAGVSVEYEYVYPVEELPRGIPERALGL